MKSYSESQPPSGSKPLPEVVARTVLVAETSDYSVYIEKHPDLPPQTGQRMGHCTVHRWSPGVLRELQGVVHTLGALAPHDPFFCLFRPGDDKFRKFISQLGFEPLAWADDWIEDGEPRHLWVRFHRKQEQ